ncbi:hypothetical protein [Acinetobacter guillouiae]|uniref:hypothetical protein n=1 Tax=Acinetobacter guillouiae TaxID=106649 RepID=UPI003AF4C1CE
MPNQYYNLAIEDGFSPTGYRILNKYQFATKEQAEQQKNLIEKHASKNVKFLIARVAVDTWEGE